MPEMQVYLGPQRGPSPLGAKDLDDESISDLRQNSWKGSGDPELSPHTMG